MIAKKTTIHQSSNDMTEIQTIIVTSQPSTMRKLMLYSQL